MPNTALITGASSGLGREFARIHAARGGDLILTARRGDALEALKAELQGKHDIAVHVIVQDLGTPGGAEALIAAVEAAGLSVDVLINNAGFGGHGAFTDRELPRDLQMLEVNVRAPMVLSHHFARAMAARGKGRMLHVGSTAGMLPGPLQATYYASKAFVNSFGQALGEELRAQGVTSTVLAPGPVATEFFETANLTSTALGNSAAPAGKVARIGYDAMLAGKPLVIDDWRMALALGWVLPFLPRRTVLGMVHRMQKKRV
ncbi:MAG: SDR family NAD(P)-dependent oxidoreductase [Limimaricola sp.]|uniref:SDR family NAD(P)-dependent oxidoreductase n=1 Tax=Limimaricola sp. TaxID=2211665 RepID=UPI001D8437C6|nr:SDR family oxidoreductase [Limimaricola sp.]MBI1415860.1 SDR family NAD(P)-dependent oxidoreductase [Limimaricola sp.]